MKNYWGSLRTQTEILDFYLLPVLLCAVYINIATVSEYTQEKVYKSIYEYGCGVMYLQMFYFVTIIIIVYNNG